MALTLDTNDYNKAIGTQNDDVIRAYSTLWNTYSDFFYIVDIYPVGFTFNGGSQLRFYIKPHPVSGKMVFNISKALKNLAFGDIITIDEVNTTNKYIFAKSTIGKVVLVSVSEYYNGAIQSTIPNNRFSVIYGSYTKERELFYFPNNMGNTPRVIGNKYFNIGNNLYFNNIRWFSPNIVDLEYSIEVYNLDTNLLMLTFDNTNTQKPMKVSAGNTYSGGVYTIGNKIVKLSTGQSLEATLNSLNNGRTYIKVINKLTEMSNTYTSILIDRMVNVNSCYTDGIMLYFFNRWGFAEHYYFPIVKPFIESNKQGITIEKYDSQGNIRYAYRWGVNTYNTMTEKYRITTDMISDDIDYYLLSNVITSHDVYCNFVNDDKLYWCRVLDTNFNINRIIYDKIKQITFTIEINKTTLI